MHTNLDNMLDGVNGILAQKLGLSNLKILSPKKNMKIDCWNYIIQEKLPDKYVKEIQDSRYQLIGIFLTPLPYDVL